MRGVGVNLAQEPVQAVLGVGQRAGQFQPEGLQAWRANETSNAESVSRPARRSASPAAMSSPPGSVLTTQASLLPRDARWVHLGLRSMGTGADVARNRDDAARNGQRVWLTSVRDSNRTVNRDPVSSPSAARHTATVSMGASVRSI